MTEPQTEVQHDPIHVDTEGMSTNFYWTFGKSEVFNLQTTIRGNQSPEQIAAHFQAAIEGMKQVCGNGGHAKPVGYQSAKDAIITQPVTPAQAAIETGKAVPPPPPPAPNGNGNAANQESHCVMIAIGESYTAKKPQLKFEVNGREHPLTYTKSVQDMAKLLAPLGFTAAHIVVGQKYPVDCIVTWRMGEKYPDVLNVRPNA